MEKIALTRHCAIKPRCAGDLYVGRLTITEPMRLFLFILSLAFAMPGCTTLERTAHMYSSEAPPPLTFQYKNEGSSVYYAFSVGDAPQPDTAVFFYGGTGCPSWKSVMPGYVSGFTVAARVFVLNKRFVPDRSTGLFDCVQEFHLANNPDRWVADYSEFIAVQISSMTDSAQEPWGNVMMGFAMLHPSLYLSFRGG